MHGADARREPALVPSCLVAVDDLLVHQRVDDRDGFLIACLGGLLVTRGDRGGDLANDGAHARTQREVSRAMLLGLVSGFFGRLGVGHESLHRQMRAGGALKRRGSVLIARGVVNAPRRGE